MSIKGKRAATLVQELENYTGFICVLVHFCSKKLDLKIRSKVGLSISKSAQNS